MNNVPVRARIYIATVIAGSIALLASVIVRQHHVDFGFAISFGVLIFLVDQFPVTLPLGEGVYSVAFVMTLAAIILRGPAEAGIAAAFGFITIKGSSKGPVIRHLFNVCELSLAATLAGLAYRSIGQPVLSTSRMFPQVIAPAVLATLVHFLVNTTLVASVFALVRGTRFAAIWRAQYAKLLSSSVAFGILGVVLAALYIDMRIAAVVFLLVPLLVARGAFQSAIEMERGFEATVRSLIKAIEAKDEYTRGHAERVSRLSEMTARAYGLSAQQCRVIRYIALMHDVGKLGVSTKILAKPGKLTDEEYEHMKQHPVRGYEIVSEIDFLQEAGETAVRHHHERMDGRGYPDGLAGEEIPVIARIVMVCDAFDSMTSTRVYRKAKSIEDAIAELHRCVGTQFDPVSLSALERAIAKEGWEAEPEAQELEEVFPSAAAAI